MTTFRSPDLQQRVDDNEVAAPKKSIFSSLKSKLNQPPKLKDYDYIDIPGRDFGLKIDANLDADKLERLRTRRTNKKGKLDVVAWYSDLLASQTECFVTKDDDREEVTDEHGDFVNFYHVDVRESVNAMDAPGAVKIIFGRDANILKAGDQVLAICGYAGADEEEDEDPLDSEKD